MFLDMPPAVQARLHWLEDEHKRRNEAKLPTEQRLLQVSPETGRFLAILAASAPAGTYLEVGTSGGYSGLWTTLGCRALSNGGEPRRLTTFEMLDHKATLAAETFRSAGVEKYVEQVRGDATDFLPNYTNVSFCFLDGWKDAYPTCYDMVVPNMVPGGILCADNVVSHREQLADWLQHVEDDPRMDAVVVPIGNGVLLARRV